MNVYWIVLIVCMVAVPALIFFRLVKNEGLPMRVLVSGWTLVSAFAVLVQGAALGAEIAAVEQVGIGYLDEFMRQPPDTQLLIAPTLLNLAVLLVFVRWSTDALNAEVCDLRAAGGSRNA